MCLKIGGNKMSFYYTYLNNWWPFIVKFEIEISRDFFRIFLCNMLTTMSIKIHQCA